MVVRAGNTEGRSLGSNPFSSTYKVQVSPRLRFPVCTISTAHGVDVRIKRVNNDKGKHVPRPRLFRKASLCAKLELAGPRFPLDCCLMRLGQTAELLTGLR